MFSAGHLIWIGISLALIVIGLIFCTLKSPRFEDVVRVCFFLGLISEFIKIFSVSEILPLVEPMLATGGSISYAPSGQYSPYLENAHLPFELCSLQIVFYAMVLWHRSENWRKRFTSLIFVSGIIGGLLGIFLASIAPEFNSVRAFFTSPRAWQYFLYHAMVVTVGIYAGFGKNTSVSFSDIKGVYMGLLSLDVVSLYLNSVFSEPLYVNAKPAGLLYRANFFSSYVNPIGLILTEKWQWIAYLLIRLALAMFLIFLLFLIQHAVRRPDRLS